MEFRSLDHVQLGMPPGEEGRARAFYVDIVGMTEIPKPADGAAGAGGCWFVSGPVHLHLGVDPEFQPAKRAHPAIVVPSLAELEGRLHPAGYPTTAGGRIPGRERVFSNDCFGNRIEWIELEEEA